MMKANIDSSLVEDEENNKGSKHVLEIFIWVTHSASLISKHLALLSFFGRHNGKSLLTSLVNSLRL